jgi:hypothetical protein
MNNLQEIEEKIAQSTIDSIEIYTSDDIVVENGKIVSFKIEREETPTEIEYYNNGDICKIIGHYGDYLEFYESGKLKKESTSNEREYKEYYESGQLKEEYEEKEYGEMDDLTKYDEQGRITYYQYQYYPTYDISWKNLVFCTEEHEYFPDYYFFKKETWHPNRKEENNITKYYICNLEDEIIDELVEIKEELSWFRSSPEHYEEDLVAIANKYETTEEANRELLKKFKCRCDLI